MLSRGHIHAKVRTRSLALLAASLPFPLLFSNVVVWILVLNWLLESSLNEKISLLKTRQAVIFFLGFYLLYAVGMLYTSNLKAGYFELEKKLSFVIFPLILGVSTNNITVKEIKVVAKSFIAACLLATLICLAQAVYLNYQEGHDLNYVYNALVNDVHLPGRYYYFNYWYFTNKLFAGAIGIHPVYFAMYLVFSTWLAIWLWNDSEDKRKTVWLLLWIAYTTVIIVLLASRTQLLAHLLLGLSWVVNYFIRKKKVLVGVLAIGILGVLCFSIIWFNPILKERFIDSNKPGSHFSENKFGEGGLSLRTYKWKYTFNVIKEHPVFGVGTGDAQDELQKEYLKQDFRIGYENNFNAHNQYLQTSLQLGMIGLLLFLGLIFYSFQIAYRNRMQLHYALLMLFLISCITESMLEANKGILFFAFFNCLLVFASNPAQKTS